MPPKAKKANEPSKKTEQKKKEKIIEDKTFGLKNKKGAKQQKFIKMVTHQVRHAGQKVRMEELNKPKETGKKSELDELNKLFKPVQQTVGKGVDPKSVICSFFKQGQCTKGDKCKFSHDLNISRKSEKINLYEDTRDDEDKMEDWDEKKLEEVIDKKHAESNKTKPKTSIICKFFLEAVENYKYGWFWTCPNGGDDCKYRHALPPGFVLKRDLKKEDKEDKISIEELVEKERAALGHNVTKVTLESFLKWKERKRKEKIAAMKSAQEKKKNDFKQGKAFGLSGREMFEFNPDLIQGDDEEAGEEDLEREEEEEEEGMNVREIDFAMYVPTETDDSGTKADENRFRDTTQSSEPTVNGIAEDDEAGKMDEAGALPPETEGAGDQTDTAIAIAIAATKDGDMNIEIDEELFEGEDLDLVEEDLETLELDD